LAHIELIALNKTYDIDDTKIWAVNNVSQSIEHGEFLSIVGHSGSGKTTLISMIGGILRPSSGKILLDGDDICLLDDDQLSEYRNGKIGFMFQFASLLPILTNKENVLLPGLFSTGYNAVSEHKAEEYLELVGLKDKMDAYPAQLSGGQQRRVAIARALVNDPTIILADEPTGDLDEETEAEMMDIFKTINQDKGVTIILITHNLELAKNASKQLRMTQGELLEI
jgi:putative ABC transport system ATP-binding protein/lipoprotein-releasing system ATP-binding protein